MIEVRTLVSRFLATRRQRTFRLRELLKVTKSSSLGELWRHLSAQTSACKLPDPVLVPDDERSRVIECAHRAIDRIVVLMGSGPIQLGDPIRWNYDYKSGHAWPLEYSRWLDYSNLDRPSDVKFPWELSRLQWLIPVGQAFWLSSDERYATFAKQIFDEWIVSNPYCKGPNWACTMEVALRIVVWGWFFQIFQDSEAWSDDLFRARFLTTLYLHGEYTFKFLEYSDVNGNHYTANLVGLMAAGTFWARGKTPKKWIDFAFRELEAEIELQTHSDGVNHEASLPYHRLNLELFLYASLLSERAGNPLSNNYRANLKRMAFFVSNYCPPDGQAPVIGDADDARLLPFGQQDLNDHRYLVELVSSHVCLEAWEASESTEHLWMFGMPPADSPVRFERVSCAFPQGGFYIIQGRGSHLVIDCGEVGLKGRGGHGHNDCLSFEAVLGGLRVIVDCGCYVYTASPELRNAFRSTSYHNTPQVKDIEINSFRSDSLWFLNYEAEPQVHKWMVSGGRAILQASHAGYEKLNPGARVIRTIDLSIDGGSLTVEDEFKGLRGRELRVPYHLHPQWGVSASITGGLFLVHKELANRQILLTFSEDWRWEWQPSWLAPSYGVKVETTKLIFEPKHENAGNLRVNFQFDLL